MRRGPNMSLDERNIAIGMLQAGATYQEVAAKFGRDASTIRRLHQKYNTTRTTKDRPRSGRPSILSTYQKKIVCRVVRRTPKILYQRLAAESVFVTHNGSPSKPPSRRTLYRVLVRFNIRKYQCKGRPKLTLIHIQKRYVFACRHQQFPWHRRTVKFSDECSVQKGSGAQREWCFRYPHEKWNKDMITEVCPSQGPQQMVWGAIWLDRRGHPRRSPLVIMERDENAPRSGNSSQSYIQVLRQGLLPHYRPGQVFMHDNARIHTSRAVRTFLADHHITTLDWPAYSPDLNPIEHLWWALKRRMDDFYSQYRDHSQTQEEWNGFCEALKDCWRRIPNETIAALIQSMPRGRQTKY